MRIVATASAPVIAPGADWDLLTRAERREAVKAAVGAALDRLKPRPETIMEGYARAMVCQNSLRLPGKNHTTGT